MEGNPIFMIVAVYFFMCLQQILAEPTPTGPLPCFLPEASHGELYSIQGRGSIHIYSEGAPDGSRLSISVRCRDIGYNAQSAVRVECQNGNWSEPIPICEIICSAPSAPVNGFIRSQRATYRHNDVIYYDCETGYTLSGNGTNYCRDADEWAHPVPTCGLPCPYPRNPRNGWLSFQGQRNIYGSVDHGSSFHVSCRRGYSVRQSTLQCNNGSWSDSDSENAPLCRGRPCLVRIPQTSQTSLALQPLFEPNSAGEESSDNWLSIPDGTKVIYRCKRGYRVQGARSFNVTCRNGRRVPRAGPPECRPAECPTVSVPNGRIRYSRNIRNQRPVHGMWRQLVCESGYESSNSSRHYCDDGQWNDTAQTALRCDPEPCALIGNSSGTIASISYNRASESMRKGLKYYPNGTVATLSCRREHTPQGDGTYHCKAREWVPFLPVCMFISAASNLAMITKSKATQSRTNIDKRGFPGKAVDGRTSGYVRDYSCAWTAKMTNPWWKTNLWKTYSIASVKIYNRLEDGDSSSNDQTGAVVRVGMDSDYRNNQVCGQPISRNAFESSNSGDHGIRIECGERGILGQYISVNIQTRRGATRQLILCEVEVYTSESNTRVSVCRIPTMDNARPVDALIGRPVRAGENVTYRCSIGYTANSTAVPHDHHQHDYVEMTCLENGTWASHQGNCHPKSCPHSGIPLSNGHLDQRDQAFIKHGDAINFTCVPGYQKQSSRRISCSLGRVVPRNPLCVPAFCHRGDLNFPPNMSTTGGRRFTHGSVVTMACETGYELVNDNSDQPQLPRCHFGQWIGPFQTSCDRVLCPTPGNTNFAMIHKISVSGLEGYGQGDRVRYQCVGNRVLEGNQFRLCSSGRWTGSVPECVNQAELTGPLPCFLPEASNGELYSVHGRGAIDIYSEGAPDGSRLDISLRCRDIGYTAQSPVWVECQNGYWSELIPICVPIVQNCDKPPSASRVEQFVNGDETMDLLYFPGTVLPEGTVLVARCSDPGSFSLRGSARRTCAAGRWEGIEPTCEHVSTQLTVQSQHPVQIRSDGTVVIYTRVDTWVRVDCRVPEGRTAEIEYEHGWSPLPSIRKYATFPTWSPYMMRARLNPARAEDSGKFTCRIRNTPNSHTIRIEFARIECEVPGIPVHGESRDYDVGWKRGTYYMTKSIYYTCDENYRLEGSSRITCVLGHWSHPVPTCEHIQCPEISPPANGTMIGGRQRRLGDAVLFSCFSGFELRGPVLIECRNNATWSHVEPECREIVLPPSPCDLAHCEVWEKCFITGEQANCGCISPLSCPPASGPVVCGTDGRNYTSLCYLKARACLLDNGVEEASSSDPCINGITIQPETGGIDSSPVAMESSSEGEPSWSIAAGA